VGQPQLGSHVGSLDGIVVLDISRLLPGPMCSWYLRGLGADVIRVDDPKRPDYLRLVPPKTAGGVSAWFSAVNAGKRSISLDLFSVQGSADLRRMLSRCDVLLESYRPGVMAHIGLDPRSLCKEFPRLIVGSITGFGQTGPLRSVPGHDLGYCAVSGLLATAVRRDGLPDVPGVQSADIAGGALTGALAIAAALVERERTGQGQWLDISMTEGALAMAALEIASTAVSGNCPDPGRTPLTGGTSVYGLYRCADGKGISFAALEPKFQDTFRRLVGGDVSLDRESLTALFATRTRDEWAAELGEACVTPILELDEVANHPQHQARGAFIGTGPEVRVKPPFAGSDGMMTASAPHVGEHTPAIRAEFGLDEEQS